MLRGEAIIFLDSGRRGRETLKQAEIRSASFWLIFGGRFECWEIKNTMVKYAETDSLESLDAIGHPDQMVFWLSEAILDTPRPGLIHPLQTLEAGQQVVPVCPGLHRRHPAVRPIH